MKLKILLLAALFFGLLPTADAQLNRFKNVRILNSLQYEGGTPGANKVLVSDADGNATWGAITDSSDIWQSAAGNVSLTDSTDDVGIGISTAAGYKLRVEGTTAITGGNALRILDATGADSLTFIDDGDTSFISSVNIIKVGDYFYLNATGVGVGQEAADSLFEVAGGIQSVGGRFSGSLTPSDSGAYNIGSSTHWWDTIFVNTVMAAGSTIILDNDVELSVPRPNTLYIPDTLAVGAIIDTGGMVTGGDIVPIDSGTVNLGAADLYFDNAYVSNMTAINSLSSGLVYWTNADTITAFENDTLTATTTELYVLGDALTDLNIVVPSNPSEGQYFGVAFVNDIATVNLMDDAFNVIIVAFDRGVFEGIRIRYFAGAWRAAP